MNIWHGWDECQMREEMSLPHMLANVASSLAWTAGYLYSMLVFIYVLQRIAGCQLQQGLDGSIDLYVRAQSLTLVRMEFLSLSLIAL